MPKIAEEIAEKAIKTISKRRVAPKMARELITVSEPSLRKVFAEGESSASRKLKGKMLEGKAIRAVTKGKGNWRYIVYDNDEVRLVTKDFVNSLARKSGTEEYTAKFAESGKKAKLAQAFKSLEMRKRSAKGSRKVVEDWFKNYKNQLKLSGETVPPTSLVKSGGQVFTMPKAYADLLKKEGAVEVLKEL